MPKYTVCFTVELHDKRKLEAGWYDTDHRCRLEIEHLASMPESERLAELFASAIMQDQIDYVDCGIEVIDYKATETES